MDLPQLDAMNRYWKQFPPMHVLLAGYVGYEGAKPKSKSNYGSAEELLSMLPVAAAAATSTAPPTGPDDAP